MKIRLSELRQIIKSVIKEESKIPDPERVKFFNNLTNQISSKLINKTIPFGKIGVLDNTSIIIQKYADRNHAVNLKDEQVYEFSIMFYVRRKEEDLYPNEKSGTRVWTGLIDITAKFNVSGGIASNPEIVLYPMFGSEISFDKEIKPSRKFSWEEVGGKNLWMSATNFNTYN